MPPRGFGGRGLKIGINRQPLLTFFTLQYRPNHGNGDFLLAGRCAFP